MWLANSKQFVLVGYEYLDSLCMPKQRIFYLFISTGEHIFNNIVALAGF